MGEPGAGRSSVRDVCGKQMRRMRWGIGQGVGLLFKLPIRAGQPLTVLSQMLFPGGDDEEFHKAMRCLAIAIEPPIHCPGPQPRPSYPAHRVEERLLILWCDSVGRCHQHRPGLRVGLEYQMGLGPIHR
jgi:hypothetical protein